MEKSIIFSIFLRSFAPHFSLVIYFLRSIFLVLFSILLLYKGFLIHFPLAFPQYLVIIFSPYTRYFLLCIFRYLLSNFPYFSALYSFFTVIYSFFFSIFCFLAGFLESPSLPALHFPRYKSIFLLFFSYNSTFLACSLLFFSNKLFFFSTI